VDSALAARADSDRRMRRFLTDASHELRTPLATIQGYAELTRQEGTLLPATTEYALARIESEARRMTSLVSEMLLLSRLDEGRPLELERIDFCALAADAINDVAVTARDHRFVGDLPDDAVWIHGDRARLHQVVTNLLTNARNHTPAGVTVTTTIRSTPGDPTIELIVADDGPGIDPELMPDLFGRFVRADKARSREMNSSGLGLAIVASIAEAHGGIASAQSRPGHTEFRVRLPASGPDTAVQPDRITAGSNPL
jgi:two-component system sensor histidine kinase TrcS